MGQASSSGKVLVNGQNVYICRTGSLLRMMPCKLGFNAICEA